MRSHFYCLTSTYVATGVILGACTIEPPDPTVLSVEPSEFSSVGGEAIIEGQHFLPSIEADPSGAGSVLSARFVVVLESEEGSIEIESERLSSTQIRVQIPANLSSGEYRISVVSPNGARSTVNQPLSVSPRPTCYPDLDGDGFGAGPGTPSNDGDCADVGESIFNTDCDDNDPTRFPSALEILDDGVDQDCSGQDVSLCYVDQDRDGFGSAVAIENTSGTCTTGQAARSGDCDDGDPSVFPGALEVPGDGDRDCSGGVTCFRDSDGDGFGASASVISGDMDCLDPGESDVATDCDDSLASRFPGAPEVANDGIDQDCDGSDSRLCFQDQDGDGVGTTTTVLSEDADCEDIGESEQSNDCDDTAMQTYPGAPDPPGDGIDQDCSGDDLDVLWPMSLEITIAAHTRGLTADVLNYPMLIRLSNSTFSDISQVLPNGGDLRFVDETSAVLAHEIESWSATEGAVWVRMGRVSSTEPTLLRMYYGNPTATSTSSASSVFQTSDGYRGVWHLNESTGGHADATANNNTGARSGNVASTGIASGAQRFDGVNDRINLGNSASLRTFSTISLSAWVNLDRLPSVDDWFTIVSKEIRDNELDYSMYVWNEGNLRTTLGSDFDLTSGRVDLIDRTTTALVPNRWYYLATTFDGTRFRLYVNGSLEYQSPIYSGGMQSRSANTYISAENSEPTYIDGRIDELRIHQNALNADRLRLDYESQRPDQSIVSY